MIKKAKWFFPFAFST